MVINDLRHFTIILQRTEENGPFGKTEWSSFRLLGMPLNWIVCFATLKGLHFTFMCSIIKKHGSSVLQDSWGIVRF